MGFDHVDGFDVRKQHNEHGKAPFERRPINAVGEATGK
jgi:hypothetical protein